MRSTFRQELTYSTKRYPIPIEVSQFALELMLPMLSERQRLVRRRPLVRHVQHQIDAEAMQATLLVAMN